MASRADEMIDRRRIRRKLTFWRVAAIAVAAIAIIVGLGRMFGDVFDDKSSDHIALIRVEGTITEDKKLLDRLKRAGEAETVKGVIINVNSPGGTTVGGEANFEAVRKLVAKKPVVAQVGTLATSAGYMIASATDHIIARQSSIVGSIGVIVQYPNVTGLLEKIGVEVETIKSTPLKAEPSPFNPTTPDERAMIEAMVLDSYEWFVSLVTERRPLSEAEVRKLADGSVFTGRQALERKLVDELGGEDEAVAWLNTKGVAEDLEIVEWKEREEGSIFGIPTSLAGLLAYKLGLTSKDGELLRDIMGDGIFLDGLLALWQPEHAPLNAR